MQRLYGAPFVVSICDRQISRFLVSLSAAPKIVCGEQYVLPTPPGIGVRARARVERCDDQRCPSFEDNRRSNLILCTSESEALLQNVQTLD